MSNQNLKQRIKSVISGTANDYVLPSDLYQEPSQKRLRNAGVRYVPFLDYSSDVLRQCQAAINTSSTTACIIKQKSLMGTGEQFILESPRTQLSGAAPIQGQDETTAIEAFLSIMNAEGETAQRVLYKVLLNVASFGNAFVEVQTNAKRTVWSSRVMPIYMCRPKIMAEGELAPRYVGISDKFEDNEAFIADYELPLWPVFEKRGKHFVSIIHIKNETPNFFYWGMPDWFSARMWCELEYRIPRYNVAKLDNGYVPSAIISLYADLSEEDKKRYVRDFKNTFTGTGSNSKMFVQVLSDKTQAADVNILETQNEGEFLELMQLAKSQIVTAHQWTMGLAGEAIAGKLGTNQQTRDEYELVLNTVVKPMRKLVLDSWLNPILKMAGFSYSLGVVDSTPLSFAGLLNPSQVLTADEQRQILGYSPLNNEQDVN